MTDLTPTAERWRAIADEYDAVTIESAPAAAPAPAFADAAAALPGISVAGVPFLGWFAADDRLPGHQVVHADQDLVLGVPEDDPAAPVAASSRDGGRVETDVTLPELYERAAEWADEEFPAAIEMVDEGAEDDEAYLDPMVNRLDELARDGA